MIVSEIPTPDLIFTDDPSRPKGLHLSTIIKDLMMQSDPDRYDHTHETREEQQAGMAKMQTGIAFEHLLERALIKTLHPHLFRPSPTQADGIWMSPDGIDPEEWAVHEYKLTWYSMNKVCPTHKVYWPWIVQIKCYSRAIQSLVARLTVYFVNGNYKPPKPHPPITYKLVFTPYELDACWQMILKHKAGMEKRGVIE